MSRGPQQAVLFGDAEEWEDDWRGMPEFIQDDITPAATTPVVLEDGGHILVHFEDLAAKRDFDLRFSREAGGIPLSRQRFSELFGHIYHNKWVWFPEKGYGNWRHFQWQTPEHVSPQYPVYIPSKGRWETPYTIRTFEALGVPFHVVVEPQEVEAYSRVVKDPASVLVLPHRDKGLVTTRNWIWDHAAASGVKKFWTFDDNIQGLYRLNRNAKIQSNSGVFLRIMEDWAERYKNLPVIGMQYELFAPRRGKHPALALNTRVYSNMLIETDYREEDGRPFRNEGFYNDDTDICLRVLKRGHCTALFYAFLINKLATMAVKGGMTTHYGKGVSVDPKWVTLAREAITRHYYQDLKDEVEDDERISDGRWRMAAELAAKHPDVTKITQKWGRWQHQVDYSAFKRNPLKPRHGAIIPEGVNDYGMRLIERSEPVAPTRPIPRLEASREPVGAVPTVQVGMFSAAPTTAWRAPEPPDLRDCRELAFDLETTGLDWRGADRPCGVAIYPRGGVPTYLPFGHRGGDNLDEQRVKDWCLTQLRGRRLWGANIKFDAHMFREWTGVDLEAIGCRLSDVQHRAALLDDHRQKFGLDVLGRDILGVGKLQGVDVTRGAHVHPSSAVGPYAERDVELTLRLADVFEPQIAAQGLGAVADLEDDIIFPVLEMERNGAPLDVEKLERWLREAEAERQATLWDVYRETGMRVDPDVNADLVALWRKLGLAYDETTTGKPSFTGAALKAAAQTHPVVTKVLHAAHLADLLAKFLVPYSKRRVGDLLTFQLEQLRGEKGGTVSGRFSAHSENIQQVLSAEKQRAEYGDRYLVRELFVPRSGVLVAADARQIQLRILAHYAESPRLLAAYAADPLTDFHAEVGKMLEPFVPGFPRKRLKITNFTRIFGGGRGKIAAQTGMSVEETETFLAAYDRAFPEGRAFLERASRAAKTRGYVRTFLGRRQRYPDCPKHGKGQRGPCPTCPRFHKAANDVVQGTEADVVKRKIVELHRRRRELGLTLRMVVHDEVVGDVPDAEAAARAAAVLDEQTTALRVSILWAAKTGANWAACA